MFRFTIRELLLLTAIVALGAAWWVDRRHLLSQLRPWGVVISPPSPGAADEEIEARVEARIATLREENESLRTHIAANRADYERQISSLKCTIYRLKEAINIETRGGSWTTSPAIYPDQ